MIIDAHNHPDWQGHNLEIFLENMTRHHIDQTWLLTWECPASEFDPTYNNLMLLDSSGPIPFSRCLAYKERAPDQFILGYAPDPRRPESIDQLQAAIDLHGVQVYGELKLRMTYDNPDALRMFRFCGEKGLPVTVHIDYEFDTGKKYPRPNWWYGGGIGALERALQACPGTNFIGHAPGFWSHISEDGQYEKEPYPRGPVVPGGALVLMLRQYPNLHADLSAGSAYNAFERDPGFALEFLLEFQDRLLFGRDTFDDQMQKFLDSLSLPSEALAKIFSGNAQQLTGNLR